MTSPGAGVSRSRPWVGPALVLGGAIAIGFAPIGLRLSEFGPQATGFWRMLFALPLIAAIVYARGGRLGRPSAFSIVAGLFFGFDIAFWHASLVLTSVANATFIVNLGNAAVGIAAWIVLKERPSRIWPVALGVALLGALLLSRGAAAANSGALAGDVLALVAAVMVGLYLFFAKLARRTESAMSVLFWSTASTLVVLAVSSGVRDEAILPPDPSWFIAPLALAVIAHVLGQGLVVAGVGRAPASVAGVLLLVQPVASALAAWPMFGEVLTPLQLSGAALILVGVWLAGRSQEAGQVDGQGPRR
jgi:drug/metabolite transporter (DMT)-like permease